MADQKGGPTPDGHYQPWLRNQQGSDAGNAARPEPLPTKASDGAASSAAPRRPARGLTADELLARPIPMPTSTDDAPSIGERLSTVASAAGAWTSEKIERADLPTRIEKLEIGRRARKAQQAGKVAMRATARSATVAANRVGAAAGPKIKTVAEQAKRTTVQGAQATVRAIGDGARSVKSAVHKALQSTPAAALIPVKHIPPPSNLDQLLAQDADAAQPIENGHALPLFANAGAAPPVSSDPQPYPVAAEQDSAAGVDKPSAGAHEPTVDQQKPSPTPPAANSGGAGRRNQPALTGADWARHPASMAIAAVALVASGVAAGLLWNGSGGRADTERVVHDYILNNPQIIPQAMEKLQADRVAGLINGQRDRIERAYSGAWAGAADGDVTLVVFTDYACTFCRASVADIDRLLREDRRLKVVFRELPILSQDSEAAARLALVAAQSGRYMAVHRALFASGNPNAATRATISTDMSISTDAPSLNTAAITNELRSNVSLARELGFDGTPSWVVGNRTLTGAVGYDTLRAAITDARSGA